MANIYEQGLDRNSANYTPITPLLFLERSAEVYPNRIAVIHGKFRQTWMQTYERCRRLASALQKHGIGLGDTVAVMLPNTPPMVEAHFGIPMAGAVLNALNTRLDPESIAFMLNHGEAKVVIVDPEFSGVMKKALELVRKESQRDILLIDVEEKEFLVLGEKLANSPMRSFSQKEIQTLLGRYQQMSGKQYVLITLQVLLETPRGGLPSSRGGYQCRI